MLQRKKSDAALPTIELEAVIVRPARPKKAEAARPSRPLRVARMLALAHTIEAKIRDGTFASQSDAALALGFTRGRVTQLLALATLAPDIQEELLFATVARGRDWVSERGLRGISSVAAWAVQRRMWPKIQGGGYGSSKIVTRDGLTPEPVSAQVVARRPPAPVPTT